MFDNDTPEFLPMPGYVRGSDTSYEAAKSLRKSVKVIREQIFGLVEQHPKGLRCETAEDITGLQHQTVSPRFTELLDEKRIEWRLDPEKPGKYLTEKNRSGRPAKLHFAVPHTLA